MRLRRIAVRRVEMPLRFRFRTSFGETTVKRFLLVEADAGDVSGWGECVADDAPLYSEETNASAAHVLRELLVPAALAKAIDGPEEFSRLVAPIRGNRMAKAALETALWDAAAREKGVRLRDLLGGVRERVPVGVSLGLQPSVEALLELVAKHVAEKYRRIKLKIEPGRDVALVSAVRERFPSIDLTVDANAAYAPGDAPALRALDPFGLDYVEQPLGHEDLWEHAALAREIATPICLDESILTARAAADAIRIGACSIVNVKPGRVGGYLEARRIHDVCVAMGVPVWCGGMLESGIGRAANLALAALPGFTLPGDTSASRRYYAEDVTPEFTLAADGTIGVPDGTGIGVEPVPDALSRLTTSRSWLPAAP